MVDKWHHSLLNCFPMSPVFTIIYSLSPGRGFLGKKRKISNTFCTLCPHSLVYAALLSSRWCQCELISSSRSDSPLLTTECLQATPSVNSSSGWDRPVYSSTTFPETLWSQLKLDLKERETTNELNKAQTDANICSRFNKFYATVNISLLARLQKVSTTCLTKLHLPAI